MCWKINLKNKKEVIKENIAKDDIIVYKVGIKNKLVTNFTSYYNYYHYSIDELNKTVKLRPSSRYTDFLCYINEGYHSYGPSVCVQMFDDKEFCNKIMISYNNKFIDGIPEDDDDYERICIGRFIIPKNSKYYVNKKGEYVSETIIFKKYVTVSIFKDDRILNTPIPFSKLDNN